MPRILDLLFSIFALLILFPFFVPIAIILFLTEEHKIFYKQDRVGYKNTNFKIVKLATMLENSPNMGSGSLTLKNDPRVLKPLGTFLRKTKINELPQILNIIQGDMSIVGPRPQMQFDFEKYSDEVQQKIYNIKPGLTGIGSIVFRDEESLISKASETEDPHRFYVRVVAPYKGELEIWYQNRRSMYLDFQLIFLTACVVVAPETRIYENFFKDLPIRKF